MPMLQVYRCPVCGNQSEPSQMQPSDWVTLNSTTGGEVFDQWKCVEQYSAAKAAAAPEVTPPIAPTVEDPDTHPPHPEHPEVTTE